MDRLITIEEGRAASKSPRKKFGCFLSVSQQGVTADIMQNSAVGNFSPNKTGTKQKRLNSKVLVSWPCVITEPGRVKKEMSDLLVLIVRKHVYNCNRLTLF
jgi:hypothetical protein